VTKSSLSKRLRNHLDINNEELHKELKEGTYKPATVKRVYIPKEKGKVRPLGIPIVKDRVVQTAVKMVIEPIFEKEFCSTSYGFRPGRGCKDALREVQKQLDQGLTWVVDADLQSYFDTIPHDRLMKQVEEHVSDSKILELIKAWLKQGIMEENKRWIPEKGTPQGAVISPLLANLYLHKLDIIMQNHGIKMVRYADDFVILTDSEKRAQTILSFIEGWTKENGLTIHPGETHIGNCLREGEGFDFLGYRFEAKKRWVQKKSILKFRDAVREKTKRNCGKSIHKVITDLNRIVKGWYNYFKHVDKWSMGTFDSFIRRRLRAILRAQKKRPGHGRSLRDHMEWPNAYFANLGLFTMKEARALEVASQSR